MTTPNLEKVWIPVEKAGPDEPIEIRHKAMDTSITIEDTKDVKMEITTPGGKLSIEVNRYSTRVFGHDNGPYEHTSLMHFTMHHPTRWDEETDHLPWWKRALHWLGLVDE